MSDQDIEDRGRLSCTCPGVSSSPPPPPEEKNHPQPTQLETPHHQDVLNGTTYCCAIFFSPDNSFFIGRNYRIFTVLPGISDNSTDMWNYPPDSGNPGGGVEENRLKRCLKGGVLDSGTRHTRRRRVLIATCTQLVWSNRIGRNMSI